MVRRWTPSTAASVWPENPAHLQAAIDTAVCKHTWRASAASAPSTSLQQSTTLAALGTDVKPKDVSSCARRRPGQLVTPASADLCHAAITDLVVPRTYASIQMVANLV